jgi:tRNA U54 and U55 pseudouridine synthase Pus10
MIKTTIIDGVEVPILPAKAVEIVKNKRTGTVYASKQEFEQDVANPETDTTVEDFSQDVQITVASLSIFGKTK